MPRVSPRRSYEDASERMPAATRVGSTSRERLERAGPPRLHLGCGPRYLPGFYHVDTNYYPHVDRVGAVEDLGFLADESVSLVYACHVLEHFGRRQVEGVLREWHRVLERGGILRLAVPDYEAWAKLYLAGKLERGIEHIVGPMVGGQRDQYDYHKMIFDEPSLTALLKTVGFATVRRWDWRQTDHGHIDDLSQSYYPHMEKDSGTLISLNVEGVK
jgi:predicted SAM-dependent methyltransferase